jgi:CMP-N,N'-diacetyllegionaminic acid synthase
MKKGQPGRPKVIKKEPKDEINLVVEPIKFTIVNKRDDDKVRVLIIIPARAGSKGIPNKNVLTVGGRPLLLHTVIQARNAATNAPSGCTINIHVSTDSKQYQTLVNQSYPNMGYCDELRPENLATDVTPSNKVVLYVLDYYQKKGIEYDVVVLLEPTQPLRLTGDITAPLAEFIRQKKYNTLVSVIDAPEHHPELCFERKVEKGSNSKLGVLVPFGGKQFGPGHPRRQALSNASFMNGGIYMAYVDKYREDPTFDKTPCLYWLMEKWQQQELDALDDVEIINCFIKRTQ